MNKPTTAITDAMIDCFSAASNIRLAFNNHRAQVAAGLDAVLAMQSATPSTPELEELVEPYACSMCAREEGESHREECPIGEQEGGYVTDPDNDLVDRVASAVSPHCYNGPSAKMAARAALEAAGISSLQKEIDTKTRVVERSLPALEEAVQAAEARWSLNHAAATNPARVEMLRELDEAKELLADAKAALSSKGGV
jgi:hypothetical protein